MSSQKDYAKTEHDAEEMRKYEESNSEDSFEIWKVKKYIVDTRIA